MGRQIAKQTSRTAKPVASGRTPKKKYTPKLQITPHADTMSARVLVGWNAKLA